MSYLNFKSEYDKNPCTYIKGKTVAVGYKNIYELLKSKIKSDTIICFDYYPGVDEEEVGELIKLINPDLLINTNSIFIDSKTMNEQLRYQLTDDRVFGKMYYGELTDFINQDKLHEAQEKIQKTSGIRLICGVGASLINSGDVLVYFDLARWEIQLRYRNKMSNFNADNNDEDILRKFKRGYFIEWRIADKHKAQLFNNIDFVVDTNKKNNPKMISGATFLDSLKQLAHQPFRTVPYFDPGVWGGQWMKEVCNLDPSKKNYAWSFDGVPEENSILFNYDGTIVELPAMDLVLYQPKELLGEKVYSRFGAEFPIRFDFLDTMEGQNLSLQVHPLTEYIHRNFGMAYTQDESYYILDAKEGACVYLGVKEGIKKDEMISDLYRAKTGEIVFDADKYINKFPAKKHDHFLIPAGTCHCSGSQAMVLEISATPYIFTFKLWDWGRLGLDGLPRPVHIDHGKQVIQWNRTTEWVKENLVNNTYEVKEMDNDCKIEHTGLHELEFIETRRYTIKKSSVHYSQGNVNMLNLIEGQKAIIESPTNEFEPFIVHYAETFIIPASISCYTISSVNNEEIKVLKAYVR